MESKKKVDSLNKSRCEKDDAIKVLETINDNRVFELNALKKESIKYKSVICHVPSVSIFNCEECDFNTENDKGLKIHMGKMHEVKCKICEETFGG